VRRAAESIAEVMDHPIIVVNKSTVPVGTGDWTADIIKSKQKRPIKFNVVSNPEFLREGNALYDFMYPDRRLARWNAKRPVRSFTVPLRATIMPTDLRTAERSSTPPIACHQDQPSTRSPTSAKPWVP
jgi:UDPglucose 6-dehydrogenase